MPQPQRDKLGVEPGAETCIRLLVPQPVRRRLVTPPHQRTVAGGHTHRGAWRKHAGGKAGPRSLLTRTQHRTRLAQREAESPLTWVFVWHAEKGRPRLLEQGSAKNAGRGSRAPPTTGRSDHAFVTFSSPLRLFRQHRASTPGRGQGAVLKLQWVWQVCVSRSSHVTSGLCVLTKKKNQTKLGVGQRDFSLFGGRVFLFWPLRPIRGHGGRP